MVPVSYTHLDVYKRQGKVHIQAGASCIGQGLGTVLVQMCCDQLELPRDAIVYERSNTFEAPDSGTTSGSRQTLITGEACRRACVELKKALEGKTLEDLDVYKRQPPAWPATMRP